MAWLAFVMQGMSAGTQAVGQWQQGEIANQMAGLNADTMVGRASEIEAEARVRADIQSRLNARAIGRLTSSYAAAGISLDQSGTYLDVLSDAAAEGELQTQLLLYGGRVAAEALRYQARLEIAMGEQAEKAGQTAAVTTLLTGFGSAAATAYKGGMFSASRGGGGAAASGTTAGGIIPTGGSGSGSQGVHL